MPKSRVLDVMAVLFGVLILSIMPLMFGSSFSVIQPALGSATAPVADINQNTTAAKIDTSRLPKEKGFSVSVLATNFSSPYNILYGPDGALWITERTGKDIVRVDPNTGSVLSKMAVPNVYQTGAQDGLMGMAFDPDFNSTHYIYVAYTYNDAISQSISSNSNQSIGNPEESNTTNNDATNPDRQTKITRFTYEESATIGEPKDLIKGLSGSTDHNSGRLLFGQDGELYYTIGDQGNNQLARYCLPNHAQMLPTAEQIQSQNWTAYEGKVLRMNPDGSIPEDNPVLNGVRSHVFTYGHRNPQGLTSGPNGDLYVSEHGDKSDDELNHLQAGGNYGWPYVSGYLDGKAYQFANWTAAENCKELTWTNIPPFPPNIPLRNESQFNSTNFVLPVHTFYTVNSDYNFSKPAGCGYVCWPTIAPSGTHFYTANAIPGWNGTILMTTLKSGEIFHLKLNENGTSLAADPVKLFRSENRYRDLAFSPDGSTIYVITDSAGPIQAIDNKNGSGSQIATLKNPGSLLEFRYEGNAPSSRG